MPRPIHDRATRQPLVAADPMLAALLGTGHAATVVTLAADVASTRAAITTCFSLVTVDSSVQLIAQGQLARARQWLQGTAHEALPLLSAASPFKAGGRMGPRYYTDIPAGPIALRQVASVQVYPNTLKAVKLTGAQVRQWLGLSAGQFRRIDPQGPTEQALTDDAFVSYNFDVIEGVSYAIDVTQPARYDPKGKPGRLEWQLQHLCAGVWSCQNVPPLMWKCRWSSLCSLQPTELRDHRPGRTELLRASHAKPWAQSTDAEPGRLEWQLQHLCAGVWSCQNVPPLMWKCRWSSLCSLQPTELAQPA